MDNQFAKTIFYKNRIDYNKNQNIFGIKKELYYTATNPKFYSELLGGNENFKNNRPIFNSIY